MLMVRVEWEYFILTDTELGMMMRKRNQSYIEILNHLGSAGWELVCVRTEVSFFKRQKVYQGY